jgi:hypothetical protein
MYQNILDLNVACRAKRTGPYMNLNVACWAKRTGPYMNLNAHWKKRSLPAHAVGIYSGPAKG